MWKGYLGNDDGRRVEDWFRGAAPERFTSIPVAMPPPLICGPAFAAVPIRPADAGADATVWLGTAKRKAFRPSAGSGMVSRSPCEPFTTMALVIGQRIARRMNLQTRNGHPPSGGLTMSARLTGMNATLHRRRTVLSNGGGKGE